MKNRCLKIENTIRDYRILILHDQMYNINWSGSFNNQYKTLKSSALRMRENPAEILSADWLCLTGSEKKPIDNLEWWFLFLTQRFFIVYS